MFRYLALMLFAALTAGATQAAVVSKTFDYEDRGTALEGFFAYDDASTEKRPGVLIIHQWRGIQDHEREIAEKLAAMGYVAFCADIYGKGIRPETTEEAGAMAGRYRSGSRDEFRARMDAALSVLSNHELVDSERIAAIGYCFGGTGVLEIARSGRDIAGVVSFHGSLNKGAAETRPVKTKVLVLHGNDDPYVPPTEVIALGEELRDAGADYIIVGYGGAVHSFTDKSANTDAARYDETADRRSWQAMNLFFEEIFN